MTVVLTGAEGLPWGLARLLAGLAFSLGLILVIVGGAELFTGDSHFLPYGLALKAWAGPEFWTAIGQETAAYRELTAAAALHNVVVATVGNLVGGSLMVGAVYWFVYLRQRA